MKELIICSAIKMSDGYIIRGHRHGNCFDTARAIPRYAEYRTKPDDQGFVTSLNRFVGREEAYKLFVEAGQVSASPDGHHGKQLFSEDLY